MSQAYGFFNCYSLLCHNFSFFALLCPCHPHSHSQSPHYCPCLWVIHTCSLTRLFFFPPLSPFPLPSVCCQCVPCCHVSSSFFFISLFCSLDFSYSIFLIPTACLFLIGVCVCVFATELYECMNSLHFLNIKDIIRWLICKYLLLFHKLSFRFVDGILHFTEVF